MPCKPQSNIHTMHTLCPSRGPKTQVGHFTAPTHKIWQWTWDNTYGLLCHASNNGGTKDVFVAGWKPTRFHYSCTRPSCNKGTICLVKPTHACGGWQLTSLALATIPPSKPESFLEVLQPWGNTWLWDNILIMGGFNWLHKAIRDGTLVAVTDGWYIRELYPNLCSAAFVLECARGWGQFIG